MSDVVKLQAADDLADAAERFLKQMDALENPRPAESWFRLKDAIKAYRDPYGTHLRKVTHRERT